MRFAKTKKDLAKFCGVTFNTLQKYLAMSDCPKKTSRGWNVDRVKLWLENKIASQVSTRGGDMRSGKASDKLDAYEVQLAKHKKTLVEYETKQFDLDLKKGLYIEREKYMQRLYQLGYALQGPLHELLIKKQPVRLEMRDAGEIRAENTDEYNKFCDVMTDLFNQWMQEDKINDRIADGADVESDLETAG